MRSAWTVADGIITEMEARRFFEDEWTTATRDNSRDGGVALMRLVVADIFQDAGLFTTTTGDDLVNQLLDLAHQKAAEGMNYGQRVTAAQVEATWRRPQSCDPRDTPDGAS
jgi:hypothetical protein